MGLLESICNLEEQEDVEKCCKCEEYRNWEEMGHCELYDCETMPSDWCANFQFSKFWQTKRGY